MGTSQAKLVVTLKTVTPLFLGGADPRGEPELRAASVRGALRFWLRALLGGVLGDHDPKILRQAESAVFGSTEMASPVVVRVEGDLRVERFRPLPHNLQKTFELPGFAPGQSLKITLAPRIPDALIPEAAVWCSLVWLLLGGLGKRSRRGFGSFILDSASDNFPLKPTAYNSVDLFKENLKNAIQTSLNKIKYFIKNLQMNPSNVSDIPRFSILHEQHTKILLCKQPFNSWEDAMKEFWKLLRSDSYRDNRVFGFAGENRQASPLHLRIVKIGENYHLLLTAFRLRFMGKQPSWEVMQKFLDECKDKWGGEWIFGGDVGWT